MWRLKSVPPVAFNQERPNGVAKPAAVMPRLAAYRARTAFSISAVATSYGVPGSNLSGFPKCASTSPRRSSGKYDGNPARLTSTAVERSVPGLRRR